MKPTHCGLHIPVAMTMISCAALLASQSNAATWDDRFGVPGASGPVNAMVVYRGSLYVAGGFDFINARPLRGIARWDGTNWWEVGGGFQGGGAYDMTLGPDGLYVVGNFTHAGTVAVGGIALWDGTDWHAVGSGVGVRRAHRYPVLSVAVDGKDVYIAGEFSYVDEVEVPFVARWDGQRWWPVGQRAGIASGFVSRLAIVGGTVYASGAFLTPEHFGLDYVAQLQDGAWHSLGDGLDWGVGYLAAHDNKLFVLGDFTQAGDQTANGFAIWDGTNWSVPPRQLESGFKVSGIYFDEKRILLAEVVQIDPFTVGETRISKWDDKHYSLLVRTGGGVGPMARFQDQLVCFGHYEFNRHLRTGNIAQWDGDHWSGLGTGTFEGMYDSVFSLAEFGGEIYAAGNFTQAGDAEAAHVARWDGTRWSTLGQGVNGPVAGLAADGRALYVAGTFDSAGGHSAVNIASYDGRHWRSVGRGFQGQPTAIAAGRQGIYVARMLLRADGMGVETDILRWDGRDWRLEANGLDGAYVTALALRGEDVFVAGKFGHAGGILVNNIARWDGQNWFALGTGIEGDEFDELNAFSVTLVSTLVIQGNDLYAGGSFSMADGQPAANVARWNGHQWSAMGDGLGNQGFVFTLGSSYPLPVHVLAIKDNELYAGGELARYYGAPADAFAKWDGVRWLPVAGAPAALVRAILPQPGALWIGGDFGIAGDTMSRYIAVRRD